MNNNILKMIEKLEDSEKIIKLLEADEDIARNIRYMMALETNKLYGNNINGKQFPCNHLMPETKKLTISIDNHCCCKWCGRHFTDDEMKIILDSIK